MWIGGKHWPGRQYVLKANAFLSCPVFNFTSVCMKAKVYLFCKNEEGLLIEKNYTSVLQFTVHMPPVIHLILSQLYKLIFNLRTHSCRVASYFWDLLPPPGYIYAPASLQFNIINGKCHASHLLMLYRRKSNNCSVYPLFLFHSSTTDYINYVDCLSGIWIMLSVSDC